MPTTLTIKATDLVRHLSSTIDQVRISGRPLLITKGAQAVAELRPPPKVGFPVVRLQELLESLQALPCRVQPQLQPCSEKVATNEEFLFSDRGFSQNPERCS